MSFLVNFSFTSVIQSKMKTFFFDGAETNIVLNSTHVFFGHTTSGKHETYNTLSKTSPRFAWSQSNRGKQLSPSINSRILSARWANNVSGKKNNTDERKESITLLYIVPE